MYLAHYIHPTEKTYYRTIWAESINEATRLAIKYARKGYKVATVRQRTPEL